MAQESTTSDNVRTRYPIKSTVAVNAPVRSYFSPRGPGSILSYGRQVRDDYLHQLPILPGAVYTFVQVAASREWTITGRPRPASRAVDYLNGAKFYTEDGVLHHGWTEFVARRVMDWLVLGRKAFLSPYVHGRTRLVRGPLQYVDPSVLAFSPRNVAVEKLVIMSEEEIDDRPWDYRNRRWANDEIFVSHLYPVGDSGMFASPVLALLPVARLAWLIQEHDSAMADGRKIRDIFMVADDQMVDAIKEAITQSVALHNGEDPSKVGLPVVAINRVGGTTSMNKMEDLFARLGISDVPKELDRDKFTNEYVNQIASTLGLGLRYFWYDPRGTNRSLEQVNEMRQTVKGPAYFIRDEERHINRSGVLGKAILRFVEETDAQAMKTRAEVLKIYAESIEKLAPVFEGVVDAPEFLAWLQKQQILPEDIDLSGLSTFDNAVLRPEALGGQPIRKQPRRDRSSYGSETPEAPVDEGRKSVATKMMVDSITAEIERLKNGGVEIPGEGEVVLDRDGNVVERRRSTYPVAKMLFYEELAREVAMTTDDEGDDGADIS